MRLRGRQGRSGTGRAARWASALGATLLVAACGATHPASGAGAGAGSEAGPRVDNITFDGVSRSYIVFSPGGTPH
ncbi:MAG: hypothetical protein ACRDYC_02775, partial [Acidimicrobiales bacterium]